MDSIGYGALASTATSLLVILGALFGAAMLIRRLRLTPWARRTAATSPITILAARPLGHQASLVIAEAQGQRFLIGISRTGIAAIGRLDGEA
jgi:flagellar biogenesis protein FliO